MSRQRHGEDSVRTSYRVEGAAAVEELQALCFLLDRRPHQLVDELVTAGLAQRLAEDPELADDVAELVSLARNHRRELESLELDQGCQASR